MPAEKVEVRWEVARDEAMKDVVRSGEAVATPQLGHSVHVEVDGLEARPLVLVSVPRRRRDQPGRPRPDDAPADRREPDSLRFAFASCQHFEHGYFTAYEHMLKDDLDLVVHLGDYIYEYEGSGRARSRPQARRPRRSSRLTTTASAYAQYRSDPHLRAMHAPLPLGRHLGRPRVRQQLRRRDLREEGRRSGRLPRASGQRLPGVLRDDAAASSVAAARASHGSVPDVELRPAGGLPGPRHPAVPHRPAQRRPPIAVERGRPRPQEHAAGRPAGGLAQGPADRVRPRPGTCWPSR